MCIITASAQGGSYNLNKANGLPSNRVYSSLVDHNGYLWLSTESGVLRYNGYTIRKFDFNDGLPNIDVWHLHEDNDNRIILSCFSKKPGYIKNNQYHPFILKGFDTSVQYIAPKFFFSKDDTLWFYNQTSVWYNSSTAYIVGDTMFNIQFPNKKYARKVHPRPHVGMLYIDDANDHIYKLDIKNNVFTEPSMLCDNVPYFIKKYLLNSTHIRVKNKMHIFDVGTKTLIHDRIKQKTYYIDLANCTIDSFRLLNRGVPANTINQQNIIWDYPYDQFSTGVVTQDSIYILDTNLNILQFSFEQLTGKKNKEGTLGYYAIYDSTWGKGLCTPSNGVYLTINDNNHYKKSKQDFSKKVYVGRENDTVSYWWDKATQNIITLCDDKVIEENKLRYFKSLKSIQSFLPNKKLVIESQGAYLFNTRNKELYNIDKKYKHNQLYGQFISALQKNYSLTLIQEIFGTIKSAIIVDTNHIYGISGGINGLYHFDFTNKDTFKTHQLDDRKLNQISYSKKHGCIFAYNDFILVMYDIKSNQKYTLPIETLRANGLQQIKDILIDKYGNIYIHDYDKVLLFDAKKLSFKKILSDYNLEGAAVDILNERLTIAGSFGVAQYNILGPAHLSKETVYPNTKGLIYNHVINMSVSKNVVTLGTDNGSYFLHTNHSTTDEKLTSQKFLLAIYKGETFRLHKIDTLYLSNKKRTFSLDAINPSGYGKLAFSYQLPNSSKWIVGSGPNINLQQLQADKFHTIKIQASDNIWKSDITYLSVFIQPRWWQTKYGFFTIGLSSILFIGVLIFIISLITKKRVHLKNEKNNLQRDLELKSVYSQINPHFIFNTLSTALYYVKKNENEAAFKHISQFSELLRAYLKSSRNKYISIAEEVENLDNYLQLQISRFDEKIKHEIVVDDKINPTNVTIPSLLLQPIVENSLNHGIFHKTGAGEIKILFKKGNKDREIICIVDDNGIGRKKAKTLRHTTKVDSYGNILIKELIATFNKYEPIFIEIDYIDKVAPDTGTTVVITINDKR